MEQLTAIAREYLQTAPLSQILAPDGDQCEIISAEKAQILSARAAALEQRLAAAEKCAATEPDPEIAEAIRIIDDLRADLPSLSEEEKCALNMVCNRASGLTVARLQKERDELAASIAFMSSGKVPAAWANCPGCPSLDEQQCAVETLLAENRVLEARAELAEARLAVLDEAADWRAGHVRINCHEFYDIETVPGLADAIRAQAIGVTVAELPERVAREKTKGSAT